MEFKFEDLKNVKLIPGATYEGGTSGNVSDDPISKLLNVGNSGGFRTAKRKDDKNKYAYVVLFYNNSKMDWKNEIDYKSSLLTYYGDNNKSGNDIFNTKHKGNRILYNVFQDMKNGLFTDIPPFFVFQRLDKGRDVIFHGLAVPGTSNLENEDLIRKNFGEFENFVSKFKFIKILILNLL